MLSVFTPLLSISAFASQSGCDDPESLNHAKAAKKYAAKYLMQLPGIQGFGISECQAHYAEDVLGENHTLEAQPMRCGVQLLFKDKQSEKNFALAARILGDAIKVYDEDRTIEVPVCGEVSGVIKPQ
jgi:hypothetical protein